MTTAGSSRSTTARRRSGRLARLAGIAYRRRRLVVAGWLVAAIAVVGLSAAFAGKYTADYAAHGSDSDRAQELLATTFPADAGQYIDLVVRTEGPVTAPAVRADVAELLRQIDEVPGVIGMSDPFDQVSPDGRTAFGTIGLALDPSESMPREDAQRVLDLTEDANAPGQRIEVGGAIVTAEVTEVSSEAVGLVAALVILLVTFGTFVAAGLPIAVALLGLAIGASLIGLVNRLVDIPDWGPQLATMMALGIGIDYVLLMLTRYREFLAEGLDTEQATVRTIDGAGRAVLVAGTTVVISMFGLFATDLNYMQGAAVGTVVCVLVIMLAAVTLVPALLGFAGRNVDRLRLPGARHRTAVGSPVWARWAMFVQRRAWPAAIVGVAATLLLAVPFLDVRFGFPDFGNSPEDQSSRQTYDLVSEGFGPGYNGPLLLVADLDGPAAGALQELTDDLAGTPGVARVGEPQVDPTGEIALLRVIPTTSPQDTATEELVHRVRTEVTPAARGDGIEQVYVGGATAMAIDTTDDITSTLPLLVGGVIGLSFLLLLAVFRSPAIAVKAAVMNILSIGAAYGVVAQALEGGTFGGLVGIDEPTPLPAFVPVLMFAVLFGLSMDYEVFLLSRMRERWLITGDSRRAVAEGLAATARVITAAAAIMVAVFFSFVLSNDIILKVIGLGLATAILVDATIVRMVLVPAAMSLMGRATWWMPAWLDRRVPQFHVEGPEPVHVLPALPYPREERQEQPVRQDTSR